MKIQDKLELLFKRAKEEDEDYNRWAPPRRCVVQGFYLNQKDHDEYRAYNNPYMNMSIRCEWNGLPVILQGTTTLPYIKTLDGEQIYLDKKLVWIWG